MNLRSAIVTSCLLLFIFCSCRQTDKDRLQATASGEIFDEQQSVISLLGKELAAPVLPEFEAAKRDSLLSVAKGNFDKDHENEENIIWYGRRLAYLSRYFAAINVYSRGIATFPESYRLLRHRGHRFISVRKFAEAAADLNKAAKLAEGHPLEIEPDGLPNRLNKPLSNTHFNILYHLGLAHYLQGNYQEARLSYETCLKYADNDDLLCATVDWLFMTYQRLGEKEKAGQLLRIINEDMQIIENDAYFKRLMMYKGLLSPDSLLSPTANQGEAPDLTMATQGYGVGHWYLMNGDKDKAIEIFQQVVAGKSWSAFGYIAAEVELARASQPN